MPKSNTVTGNQNYKAYFLGPKAENEAWVRSEIQSTFDTWFQWRKNLFSCDAPAITKEERLTSAYQLNREKMAQQLSRLNDMLADEIPKFTPRYLAHMVSDLALPALMGHMAVLLHNPNLTSKEAAKVGAVLEDEMISMLGEMVGFDPIKVRGHATGGGTVANFEAIWRARFRQDHWLSLALYMFEEKGVRLDLFDACHMGWDKFNQLVIDHQIDLEELRTFSAIANNPYAFGERMTIFLGAPYRGPIMLVPQNKHFSWAKGANVFGLGETSFWPVPLDHRGKLKIEALNELIVKAKSENRPIMMVVSVAGTTETGEIDPIHKVQALLDQVKENKGWDLWHHIDAAYGGFFCSMLRGTKQNALTDENTLALQAISKAHSVTIDPHKMGYVPYACGAILVRDSRCYSVSSFKAPYLERQKTLDDKWSTTLEGSRSAAGVVGTWLTGKTLGFDGDGMGAIAAATIQNCRQLTRDLTRACDFIHPLDPIDTNIVCLSIADQGDSLQEANKKTEAIYSYFQESPDFSISKTTLSLATYPELMARHCKNFYGELDSDTLVLLRCVLMNPFWDEEALKDPITEELIENLHKAYDAL